VGTSSELAAGPPLPRGAALETVDWMSSKVIWAEKARVTNRRKHLIIRYLRSENSHSQRHSHVCIYV